MRNPVLLLVFISIAVISCHRVERKGKSLAAKAKQTAVEVKDTVNSRIDTWLEKKFPSFDAYKADTEHNKNRFASYLEVPVTDDVKGIYTYGDFMGIDYKVLIAFCCNQNTIKKIVAAKKMHQAAGSENGLLFSGDFPWWDKSVMERLRPWKVGEEYKYREYLWYDDVTGKAYYLEFSM